jgi:catechol 2,3-dioxygenase-like lactoylglutathione lyase family enzyme
MTTIVLWVSNLEKSVDFYKSLFEDAHPYVSETFASVGNANNEVLIHLLPEEYRSEPTLGEDNPIKPVFTIDSIEKAKLAAGHIKSDTNEYESWRYADGNDPDGNVIQVRERI